MGYQDRDWMRDDRGPRWGLFLVAPKWILMAMTVAGYLAQSAVANGTEYGDNYINSHFALTRSGVLRGELWQPLTYMFLHAGLGHLCGNMLALWVFATVLEDRLTAPEAWRLYLVGGLGGAAGHLLWAAAGLPGGTAAVVGASGAVTALLLYAVLLSPSRVVYVILLPVPLWVVGAIFIGWNVIEAMVQLADRRITSDVAVQAHLGGAAAAGVLFLLARGRRRKPARGRARREKDEERNVLVPATRGPDDTAEEARMDALLERIHASGIGSLTEEERQFLKRVSERYRGKKR